MMQQPYASSSSSASSAARSKDPTPSPSTDDAYKQMLRSISREHLHRHSEMNQKLVGNVFLPAIEAKQKVHQTTSFKHLKIIEQCIMAENKREEQLARCANAKERKYWSRRFQAQRDHERDLIEALMLGKPADVDFEIVQVSTTPSPLRSPEDDTIGLRTSLHTPDRVFRKHQREEERARSREEKHRTSNPKSPTKRKTRVSPLRQQTSGGQQEAPNAGGVVVVHQSPLKTASPLKTKRSSPRKETMSLLSTSPLRNAAGFVKVPATRQTLTSPTKASPNKKVVQEAPITFEGAKSFLEAKYQATHQTQEANGLVEGATQTTARNEEKEEKHAEPAKSVHELPDIYDFHAPRDGRHLHQLHLRPHTSPQPTMDQQEDHRRPESTNQYTVRHTEWQTDAEIITEQEKLDMQAQDLEPPMDQPTSDPEILIESASPHVVSPAQPREDSDRAERSAPEEEASMNGLEVTDLDEPMANDSSSLHEDTIHEVDEDDDHHHQILGDVHDAIVDIVDHIVRSSSPVLLARPQVLPDPHQTRKQSIVRIQSAFRGHSSRRAFRFALYQEALECGVLGAMPGTTQGKSGWYQDPKSLLAYYFVIDEQSGEWKQKVVLRCPYLILTHFQMQDQILNKIVFIPT